MQLEDYQFQTRNVIEQTLNRLQAATLLAARLEIEISETGRSVQDLSRLLELFLTDPERPDPDRPENPD